MLQFWWCLLGRVLHRPETRVRTSPDREMSMFKAYIELLERLLFGYYGHVITYRGTLVRNLHPHLFGVVFPRTHSNVPRNC